MRSEKDVETTSSVARKLSAQMSRPSFMTRQLSVIFSGGDFFSVRPRGRSTNHFQGEEFRP